MNTKTRGRSAANACKGVGLVPFLRIFRASLSITVLDSGALVTLTAFTTDATKEEHRRRDLLLPAFGLRCFQHGGRSLRTKLVDVLVQLLVERGVTRQVLEHIELG